VAIITVIAAIAQDKISVGRDNDRTVIVMRRFGDIVLFILSNTQTS
jgi:hypothetical protein